MKLTVDELVAELVELQAEQKLISARVAEIKDLLGPGEYRIRNNSTHVLRITGVSARSRLDKKELLKYVSSRVIELCTFSDGCGYYVANLVKVKGKTK